MSPLGVADSQQGDTRLSANKVIGQLSHSYISLINKMWEESLRFYLFGYFSMHNIPNVCITSYNLKRIFTGFLLFDLLGNLIR